MKKIIIIGCGGHASSCAEILENSNGYSIFGFICNSKNKKNLDYKILGNDTKINIIKKKCKNALIGVGQIKDYKKRLRLFNLLKKKGFNIPKVIAKTAYVSKNVKILEGTIVMNKAFINKNANIGKNCIINTGAIIEHDVKIGSNCHISTGVIVNGHSIIGDNCFIGSGSVINDNVKVPRNTFIPAMTKITKKSIIFNTN